jgi:cytochrome c oxidase subunit 2
VARRGRGAPAAALLALTVTLGATSVLSACGDDGADKPAELSAAGRRGQTVARDRGCTACHTADGSRAVGPTFKGLAGSKVALVDGSTVTADDAYLTRAITDPGAQVAAGYTGIMPTAYGDLLSASEVRDLVAYLRDLGQA